MKTAEDPREKDIQAVCSQIINMSPCYYPSSSYHAREYSCPFCYNDGYESDMDSIEHDQTCAYLIAKDLHTGHPINSTNN